MFLSSIAEHVQEMQDNVKVKKGKKECLFPRMGREYGST